MTNYGKPISFIATANAVKSRHFYETVLSLKCLSEDPFALVFDLGGMTLRIQKVELIPDVKYTVLGWEVDNIQHCVENLSQKGVRFERFPQLPQDESGVWTSPSGAFITWFKDPDGNTLSLTQI